MRVLHVPANVAGNPFGISQAEKALGIQSRLVTYVPSQGGYQTDELLFHQEDGWLRQELKKWRLVLRALRRYDVIHYNFGSPMIDPLVPRHLRSQEYQYPAPLRMAYDLYRWLFGMKDAALLKRAGKVIFVTYQGGDARQLSFHRDNFPIYDMMDADQVAMPPGSLNRFEMDEFRAQRVKRFAKYADRIFALNPDLLRFLPPTAQFLPYASVDPREWTPPPACLGVDAPLRIIHAPSGRVYKGTKHLLAAVERLRDEGMQFDFELIENVPHDRVKEMYTRADLLVDQLLAGWYGALAVELMALGKPVIAYMREEDLKFIPPAMKDELPIINANPYTIYDVLKKCLAMDRSELRTIGARGRAYVEKWHDPLKIAAHLKQEAETILEERRRGRKEKALAK